MENNDLEEKVKKIVEHLVRSVGQKIHLMIEQFVDEHLNDNEAKMADGKGRGIESSVGGSAKASEASTAVGTVPAIPSSGVVSLQNPKVHFKGGTFTLASGTWKRKADSVNDDSPAGLSVPGVPDSTATGSGGEEPNETVNEEKSEDEEAVACSKRHRPCSD